MSERISWQIIFQACVFHAIKCIRGDIFMFSSFEKERARVAQQINVCSTRFMSLPTKPLIIAHPVLSRALTRVFSHSV